MTAPSWKNANKPSISVNVKQSCQRVHPEKRLCITVRENKTMGPFYSLFLEIGAAKYLGISVNLDMTDVLLCCSLLMPHIMLTLFCDN